MHISKFVLAAALLCGTADLASAYPAATRSALNLRSAANVRSRVVMVVPRAATVDVRSCTPNWCNVSYRGRVGYLSRIYLAVRPAPPPPPVARRPAPPPEDQFADRDDQFEDRFDNQGPYEPDDRIDDFDRDAGYGQGPRFVCVAEDADWTIGRRATGVNINRARDDANARTVRVVEPDAFYTREFRRDRLTIEVDDENFVVDVRCG